MNVIQFRCPQAKRQLSADEQRIIDFIERVNGGRKLTPQEINLSLEQARALGEL
jgi:hypothetical protein